MKKSSMADVAKLAGVSTATVSYVINGTRFVSAEVTSRVNEAIKQLGYSPNMMARSLRTKKSNAVLFVVPDVGNSFFSTAIEEVEEVLTKQCYRLLIANTNETMEREATHLKGINSSIVDGIILASTAEDWECLKDILPTDLPIILLDRMFPGCNLCSVTIDCTEQIEQAIVKLAKKGHVRIGFIAGYARLSTTKARVNAYRRAMERCHLMVENDFVLDGDTDYLKVQNCCDRLFELGCTALIASNGAISFFARHVCDLRGKTLGRDVEIVGFVDAPNTDLMTEYFSTIYLPINEMARMAGEHIIKLINGQATLGENIQLSASQAFRD